MNHHFFAAQTLQVAVTEQGGTLKQYLRQTQRIVKSMGDPSRIEQITPDRFRLQMRPLQLFSLKIEPRVEMKIWTDAEGMVHLKSVGCELKGMENMNQHFHINVTGKMHATHVNNKTNLEGSAELDLKIFLPPPFNMMPKSVVTSAVKGLLNKILLKIKRRLMEKMLADYYHWSREQNKHLAAA